MISCHISSSPFVIFSSRDPRGRFPALPRDSQRPGPRLGARFLLRGGAAFQRRRIIQPRRPITRSSHQSHSGAGQERISTDGRWGKKDVGVNVGVVE